MADQPFVVLPKSNVELRDAFLRDLRLAAIDTGITTEPPVEPGSDYYTRLRPEAAKRRAIHQLEGMGYRVTLDQAS